MKAGTVEPRFNEGPRVWQNLFVVLTFFFTHFTISGVMKIACYTEEVVI